MRRPSAATIAWCTAVVITTLVTAYSYLAVHHASLNSYMQFIGNALPPAAGIILVLLKLDKVEKNTNGALSSQTNIVQETLPQVTDTVAELKTTVDGIRNDINTAKHTFPALMNALSDSEVKNDADQHDH